MSQVNGVAPAPPLGNRMAGQITASSCTLVIAIAGTLPWGMPEVFSFVAPLLTLSAIHFWSWTNRFWMPVWLAFALGLLIDLLSQGPFGYWSFLFTLAHALAVILAAITGWRGRLRGWLTLAVSLAVIAGAAWAIASLYFLKAQPVTPIGQSALVVWIAFPILATGLQWIARSLMVPSRLPRAQHRGSP